MYTRKGIHFTTSFQQPHFGVAHNKMKNKKTKTMKKTNEKNNWRFYKNGHIR
jgi:hypothetical protein